MLERRGRADKGPALGDEQLVPWWEWQEGKRPAGWTERDERRWRGETVSTSERCGVCRQGIPDDELFDETTRERHHGDRREVVLRNGLVVRSCLRCWAVWPDSWKRFPSFGYGRLLRPTTAGRAA
jgi:hypothetical protein